MKTTLYAHGDKESLWGTGEKLGLTGEALKLFSYCLCEVAFEVEVDAKSGEIEILKVDGQELKPKSKPITNISVSASNPELLKDKKLMASCVKKIEDHNKVRVLETQIAKLKEQLETLTQKQMDRDFRDR